MLIAESITVKVGRRVVFKDLSLNCSRGAYCILGKNGVGKSTLLKSLAGGIKPVSGRIVVDDVDMYVGNMRRSRSQIGYLPERPELYDFLTAREFLNFVASVKRITPESYMDIAQQLAMTNCLDKRMDALSNGQRRKITLICCLMNQPSHLILDEPTNAFDKEAVAYIKTVIKDYLGGNKVVVFVTHNQNFLNEFGQHIYSLENGILSEHHNESRLELLWQNSCLKSHPQA